MRCKNLNGIETSIGKCVSIDDRFIMMTRWELGNNHYIRNCRYLYIEYSGTEEKFDKEKLKANLTNEMKNVLYTLPESVRELTNLRVLIVYGEGPERIEKVYGNGPKKISLTTLPDFIGNLADLRILELPRNYLENLPNSIGNLKNLQILNLSSNNLRELPDSIGNLKNLQILNLSSNNLRELPDSIGNLKNLQILNLELPDSIGNLKNLQILNLSSNNLRELPDSIGNLKNLQILNLSSNNLRELPDSIGNLKNLEELKFRKSEDIKVRKNESRVITRIYGELDKLRRSIDLSIWYRNIIDQSLKHWSCPPLVPNNDNRNLEQPILSLNLSGNNLTQIPFCVYLIKELKELDVKELKIDGKLIKDLPENAEYTLDNENLEDGVLDLTLDSKNTKKMSDKQLSRRTGPYKVHLKKKP
ncbi:hypothetical protein PIROE2DRAFT_17200 [Piromyces sp. E2]|nr:hypothetical protein PIROE2DRAFT_17200 [Piromyces sp. E2]|eukprot:OUM57718.1 hypothetical protein PIROE2DRAFT_17200 [Piromyces sp. E2]